MTKPLEDSRETPPGGKGGPRRGRRRRRLLIALGAVLVVLIGYGTWTNVQAYTLRASIVVDATPDQVWQVLTDVSRYKEWNPFIVSSSVEGGRIEKGATMHNVMRDADGDTEFAPKILAARTGRELRWIGKITPGGIFDGEHRFLIQPLEGGKVRLTQSEEFTGVMIPFFRGKLHDKTLPQFHAMNRALAQRVSAGAGG